MCTKWIILGRADLGVKSRSDLPSLPSVVHTASSTSSTSTSTSNVNEPLTVFNADDFFVMKASSECKYI